MHGTLRAVPPAQNMQRQQQEHKQQQVQEQRHVLRTWEKMTLHPFQGGVFDEKRKQLFTCNRINHMRGQRKQLFTFPKTIVYANREVLMIDEKSTATSSMSVRLARATGRGARARMANARVTPEELAELEKAARGAGTSLSEWARENLLSAARKPADDVLLTELVATRLILLNLIKPLAMGRVLTEQECANITTQVHQVKRKIAGEIEQQYAPKSEKEG